MKRSARSIRAAVAAMLPAIGVATATAMGIGSIGAPYWLVSLTGLFAFLASLLSGMSLIAGSLLGGAIVTSKRANI